NYASSQFAPPAVFGSTQTQIGDITALQFPGGDIGMSVVGNVLGLAGWTTTYEGYNSGPKCGYQLREGGAGALDGAAPTPRQHALADRPLSIHHQRLFAAPGDQPALAARLVLLRAAAAVVADGIPVAMGRP